MQNISSTYIEVKTIDDSMSPYQSGHYENAQDAKDFIDRFNKTQKENYNAKPEQYALIAVESIKTFSDDGEFLFETTVRHHVLTYPDLD